METQEIALQSGKILYLSINLVKLRWCPTTLISRHFTPTKDANTGKAKSAAYWLAYWLVHGSLCVRFVMNA